MDAKTYVTTNEITKLEYGMRILFPCRPISYMSPMMGVALTSSSTPTEMIEMKVCKYWDKDDDANIYKVKLKPVGEINRVRFGNENLYSQDLKSLILQGTASLILNS